MTPGRGIDGEIEFWDPTYDEGGMTPLRNMKQP
jgi:hypothetical protein